MTTIIWTSALAAYGLFWAWYVGFRPTITPDEVDACMAQVDASGQVSPRQREAVRHFLASDNGRDFVMVNLLHLAEPLEQSREKLDTYQKLFLGQLLRKAGHPVFFARAGSGNIENVNCEHADGWHAAAMVRYRSRRDFMEMLLVTVGSDHHALKLEAMEKTFAFPSGHWFMFGGPRIQTALSVILVALLFQLALG